MRYGQKEQQLTSTDVAMSILSKCPPSVELKPQQAPVLLTATVKVEEAQACSAPVQSITRVDPIW